MSDNEAAWIEPVPGWLQGEPEEPVIRPEELATVEAFEHDLKCWWDEASSAGLSAAGLRRLVQALAAVQQQAEQQAWKAG